jgi:nicotinamide-nucleotide amidase
VSTQCLLICVGSELLRGKVNTHASTLAQRFQSLGIDLAHEETVPDALPELTDAIRRGLDQFPLVIVTGGLGPTFDDLSREAAAAASGRALKRSSKLLAELKTKFWKARYKTMPPMNARQADVIEGAIVIPNDFGTAPGQWLQSNNPSPSTLHSSQVLVLLPGPPRELKPMLDGFVLTRLRRTFPSRPRAETHLHFVGIGESLADQKIRPILKRYEKKSKMKIDFTILAHLGLVDFDVFVEADRQRLAERTATEIGLAIQKKLKPFCYGINDEHPLEKVIGDALRASHTTLAVAESCTGGLLSAQLTEQAGSSDYFLGGVISYSNAMKETQLGVPQALLKQHGAVSAEVAMAMAQGVRERLGSTYGISITGIAGPGGGTSKKPVGLVYIGLATPRGKKVQRFNFSGPRDVVRSRAVTAALDFWRQEFLVKSGRFR